MAGPMSVVPGKGVFVPLNSVRILRPAFGERSFWDSEFQEMLRGSEELNISNFLPKVQLDETHALFQLYIDGQEFAGRSRQLRAHDLTDADFQRLDDAMK